MPPRGKRVSTTSKRRNKHKSEQIIAKLRDADAMLNAGKDLAAVLQALEIVS
jgi:putative transposase